MANIDPYVNNIRTSVYGENVRSSIADALLAMNNEIDTQIANVVTSSYQHNNIYRRQYLGRSFTTAQKNAINDGSFDNLYLGDYWGDGTNFFTIVDFNYFYNIGLNRVTTNHIVVMPSAPLYSDKMNDTETTEGAYRSSKLRSSGGLDDAKTTFESIFGSAYILPHDEYIEDSVDSDGAVNGCNWQTCTVEIPSERMIYGTNINWNRKQASPYNYVDKCQFSAFRIRRDVGRVNFWLRDVSLPGRFCFFNYGASAMSWANISRGVYPYALICGTPQT